MTNTNDRAKVPQDVIDAVRRYGDARADDAPTFDAMGKVIETIRAAISSAVPDGGKGETVISRPDWLRIFGTHFEVNSTWDDGTPRGVYCESFSFDAFRREIESLYTAPQAERTPRCKTCDGTGDVHSIDGEWRGECTECAPRALTKEEISKLEKECWGTLPTGRPFFDSTKFARAIEQAVNKGAQDDSGMCGPGLVEHEFVTEPSSGIDLCKYCHISRVAAGTNTICDVATLAVNKGAGK